MNWKKDSVLVKVKWVKSKKDVSRFVAFGGVGDVDRWGRRWCPVTVGLRFGWYVARVGG